MYYMWRVKCYNIGKQVRGRIQDARSFFFPSKLLPVARFIVP